MQLKSEIGILKDELTQNLKNEVELLKSVV